MKNAFSLVELLITVAIIGILAAIVLPEFQSNTADAKAAAAKDNLRILRNAIELYAAQHNDIPPGYLNDCPPTIASSKVLSGQLTGKYVTKMPRNPFNGISSIKLLQDDEAFPTEPLLTDLFGWIYKPATRTIKFNWPGNDHDGIAYFDY